LIKKKNQRLVKINSSWCEEFQIYHLESCCDWLQVVYLFVTICFVIEKYEMEKIDLIFEKSRKGQFEFKDEFSITHGE
jgi:hypothetical protein